MGIMILIEKILQIRKTQKALKSYILKRTKKIEEKTSRLNMNFAE